ncbi:hypothetical protein BaRGS_00028830, partial [Batillaria attramentaria]
NDLFQDCITRVDLTNTAVTQLCAVRCGSISRSLQGQPSLACIWQKKTACFNTACLPKGSRDLRRKTSSLGDEVRKLIQGEPRKPTDTYITVRKALEEIPRPDDFAGIKCVQRQRAKRPAAEHKTNKAKS